MKKIFILSLFMLIPLTNSAELNSQENKSTYCAGKQVIGKIEKVSLLEKNLILDAKLDTGATMSSLSAKNIKIFERNNKAWVSFTLYIKSIQEKVEFITPLVGYANILKRSEEKTDIIDLQKYSRRPVISLLTCFGNQKRNILFNLADRSLFRYSLILGTNDLSDFKVLIDVDHNYLSTLHCSGASS